MTFVRPPKAENTDPRTNDAVEYATARGHLINKDIFAVYGLHFLL